MPCAIRRKYGIRGFLCHNYSCTFLLLIYDAKIARLARNRVAKNMLVEGMAGGLIPVFCFGFGGDVAAGFFQFGRLGGFAGQAAELLQIGVVDPIFHFKERFLAHGGFQLAFPYRHHFPAHAFQCLFVCRVACFVL